MSSAKATDKAKESKHDKKLDKKDKKDKKDKHSSKKDHSDVEKAAKKDKKSKKSKDKDSSADKSTTDAKAASSAAPKDTAAAAQPTNAAAAQAYLAENSITIEVPEESNAKHPLPMLSFTELGSMLDSRLKAQVDAQGYTTPTPIQACCWPVLLQRSDVVGVAETGSGKTMAFGIPALQHVLENPSKNIQVLVVAPTRELAIQTGENIARISEPLGIGSFCVYGGVSKSEQLSQLRKHSPKVRILVGTPGRVLDLANEGAIDLSHVSFLTLDEADRMLDKGFEPDIRAIIGMTLSHSDGRHTSMFSATWPPAVRGLAESFMREPIRVTVGSDELSANRRVAQTVVVLDDGRQKERRLDQFLRSINAHKSNDKILVFALYKKEAQRVENTLRRNGYRVSGIHGDLSQQERIASLDRFKSAETPILVATDVAARGLDIPNVEHVVNHTFPLTIEDYIHRIGRTGRGGKTGKALTFFTDEDKAHAGELIRVLKDAEQPVPEPLTRFPTTIKRKTHSSYGDHYKELVPGKAKKITFDDD
ncbi:RNA helicase [Malassezia cuniculi]|uniref:RNA helicase n=1 Tax=Malassezia cuniculi TaxID=948313 RepID=A0AAF0J5W8_9BASI|nr:RNA helicase [Malassezia cuniculi]